MAQPPDFPQIAHFFREARDYFKQIDKEKLSDTTEKWILQQKERLMSRLAAHWQFLWKCHLYKVSPTHITETGCKMNFSCAIMCPNLRLDRKVITREMSSFIESCGLPFTIQEDESLITFNIVLGS